MKNISVIILTFNESIHIERCIKSLRSFADEVFIVDSFSTDNTIELAEKLGAQVFQNKWVNYSEQFQWGLDNCPITNKWVMRMDADEYVEHALELEIIDKINGIGESVKGIYLKRKYFFMGQWIKHGGRYPLKLLRIWQHGFGNIEKRWMDEHIVLSEGDTIEFDNDIVDDNLNNITWWTAKHNGYATREMIDLLNLKYRLFPSDDTLKVTSDRQAKIKRILKEKVYVNLPVGLRPMLYFLYRYFIQVGFLDGTKGFLYHFMQGFWYRLLVDIKVLEIERKESRDPIKIKKIIACEYNVKL